MILTTQSYNNFYEEYYSIVGIETVKKVHKSPVK